MRDFLTKAAQLVQDSEPFCTVTLVAKRGSVPGQVGAKILVTKAGLAFGTVGGGKVEARAISEAQGLLQKGEPHVVYHRWNLRQDLGMTCGGAVEFFLEPWVGRPPWSVAIFGAGHVSQELSRVLLRLDCQITVWDSRPEWLEQLPEHSKLNATGEGSGTEVIAKLPTHHQVVIMTQGHKTDLPILQQALAQRFPYVGVIGSPSKRQRLVKDLIAAGCNKDEAENFHCPMGLPLGQNNPPEIALSIASQLVWCRDASRDQMPAKWRRAKRPHPFPTEGEVHG